MEPEESSHPPYPVREQSNKQNPTNGRFTGRERIKECLLPSHRNFSERIELGVNPQQGNASQCPGEPSLLEVGYVHPTILKVENSIERGSCPTLVTPFSREILEAPRLSKVKMPSVDFFDGTTNPNDHLDVYKAQMYFQDADDATCCQYVPATLKGIT